jgi:hypothetical protein
MYSHIINALDMCQEIFLRSEKQTMLAESEKSNRWSLTGQDHSSHLSYLPRQVINARPHRAYGNGQTAHV